MLLLFAGQLLHGQSTTINTTLAPVPVGPNSTVNITFSQADFAGAQNVELLSSITITATGKQRDNGGGSSDVTFTANTISTTLSSGGGTGCGPGADISGTINNDFDLTCFDGNASYTIEVGRGQNICSGDITLAIEIEYLNAHIYEVPTLINPTGPADISLDITSGCDVALSDVEAAIAAQYMDNVATNLTVNIQSSMATYGETCSTGSTDHSISFTVEDDCGQETTSETINLSVNDVDGPTFSGIPNPVIVNTNNNCSLSDNTLLGRMGLDAYVSDNCSASPTIAIVNTTAPYSLNGSCTNTFSVDVQATDDCGQVSAVTTVMVQLTDNNPPVLSGVSTATLVIESCADTDVAAIDNDLLNAITAVTETCNNGQITEFSLDATFATDVYPGTNFTVPLNCPPGTPTTIWVRAQDVCGNISAVHSVEVSVEDVTDPDVSALTEITMVTGANDCFVTPQNINNRVLGIVMGSTPLITDDCTPSDMLTFTITGGLAEYSETCSTGTPHTITYDVTDGCGNTVTGASFTLNVNDNSDPVVTGNVPVNIYLDKFCVLDSAQIVDQAMAQLYANGFSATDNCDMMLDSVIGPLSKNSFDVALCAMINTVCFDHQSTDTPKPINDQNLVFSSITVSDPGNITDLNISNLDITHTYVADMRIILTHIETGTSAIIMELECGSNEDIDASFDDSGVSIVCGNPTSGNFQPFEAFSVFNGESLAGTWELQIQDLAGGDDGTLNGWALELCSDVASDAGSFDVTYTDDCNGVSSGSTTITVDFMVLDSMPPTLILPASLTISDPENCPNVLSSQVFDALANTPGFTAADNCTEVDTIISYDDLTVFELPVTCSSTYRIRVELRDQCGPNIVFDSIDVIIEDKSMPDLSGIGSTITFNTGINSCSRAVSTIETFLRNNADDQCSNINSSRTATITNAPANGEYDITCDDNTPHLVEYTVTDSCGNAAMGSVLLNIIDAPTNAEVANGAVASDAAPTVTVNNPADPIDIVVSVKCDITESALIDSLLMKGKISVTDQCDPQSLTIFFDDAIDPYLHFGSNCVNGATRRFLDILATDACGNTSATAVQVIVDLIDDTAPMLVGPGSVIAIDDSAVDINGGSLYPGCMITKSQVQALIFDQLTIDDNCNASNVQLTYDFKDSNGDPVAFITQIDPLIDPCQNTSTLKNIGVDFIEPFYTGEFFYTVNIGTPIEVDFIYNFFVVSNEYLPVQCAGDDPYVVSVTANDLCTNNTTTIDVEVSFIDDTDPMIKWDTQDELPPVDPIEISDFTGDCEITNDDVLDYILCDYFNSLPRSGPNGGVLKNGSNGIVHFYDNCSFESPSIQIVEAGPWSSKCGANVHTLTLLVTDACGLTATSSFQIEVIDENPFPSLSIPGINGIPIVLQALADDGSDNDPFPLANNNNSSLPDDLYGGEGGTITNNPGDPTDPNEWHNGSEPRFASAGTISIELDASCALSMADIEMQVENMLVISDDCSTNLTVEVIIRENDTRFDQNALNTVDPTTLTCGDGFGLVVLVSDDCSPDPFTTVVGYNAEVVSTSVPSYTFSSNNIIINSDDVAGNPCTLNEADLLAALAAEVATNSSCGDINLFVSLDDPDTPNDDESGNGSDIYSDNELTVACASAPQMLTLYVTAFQTCGTGTSGNTTNSEEITVSFIDNTAPTVGSAFVDLTISTNGMCAYTGDITSMVLTEAAAVLDNCTSPINASHVSLSDSGPYPANCQAGATSPQVITATIVDDCNNMTTVTVNLEVNDETIPVIVPNASANRIPLDMDADCSLDEGDIIAQILAANTAGEIYFQTSDNCTSSFTAADYNITNNEPNDYSTGFACGSGETSFMLEVTDECGQTSSAVQIFVKRIDTTDPVVNVSGPLVIDDSDWAGCLIAKFEVQNLIKNDILTVSDNCSSSFAYTYDFFESDGVTPLVFVNSVNNPITPYVDPCGYGSSGPQIYTGTTPNHGYGNFAGIVTSNFTYLPVQCATDAPYVVKVTVSDQCSDDPNNYNDTEVTVMVSFIDDSLPIIEWQNNSNAQPIIIDLDGTCEITDAEILELILCGYDQSGFEANSPNGNLKNGPNGYAHIFDNCGFSAPIVEVLDAGGNVLTGPLSADCNNTPRDLVLRVDDGCNPAVSEAFQIIINELDPEPSISVPASVFEISLDTNCEITEQEIFDAITASGDFMVSDNCTQVADLATVLETRLNNDLNGANDITFPLSGLNCGLEFMIDVTVTDACGLTDAEDVRVRIVSTNPPVLTGTIMDVVVNTSDVPGDCTLSAQELKDYLLDSGSLTTASVCDQIDLTLHAQDPSDDPFDNNGAAPNFYAGAELTSACVDQKMEIWVTATASCGGVTSAPSNQVLITVSFIDDEDPTITFINDNELINNSTITRNALAGNCFFKVRLDDKFSFGDNCSSVTTDISFDDALVSTYVQNGNTFADFPVGTTEVTITATDACTLSSDAIFNVTVNDVTDPIIICDNISVEGLLLSSLPNSSYQIGTDAGQCSNTIEYYVPAIGDPCGIQSVGIDYSMSGVVISTDNSQSLGGDFTISHTFQTGTTTVTVTITDVNNLVSTCTFSVYVFDSESPELICPNQITVVVGSAPNQAVSLTVADILNSGAILTDNCGIVDVDVFGQNGAQINAFDCDDIGQNPVTVRVRDAAGLTATCVTNIMVVDNEIPVITPNPNEPPAGTPIFLECGEPYTELLPTLTDNCSIVGQVVISGVVNTNVPGTYFVHYDGLDASGNAAVTFTRTVIVGNLVSDLTNLNIQITPSTTNVCPGQNATFSFSPGTNDPNFPNNVTITWSYTGNQGTVTSGQNTDQATFAFGPNANSGSVILTIASSNSSGCGFEQYTASVTVDQPQAICQDISVPIDPNTGFVQITPQQIDNGSFSSCGNNISLASVSPSVFTCSNIGVNTVTLTVVDDLGNTATCTADVTVTSSSNSAPLISGPSLVCSGQDGFVFSVAGVSANATIVWSHSLNNAVFLPNGPASISVNFQDEASVSDGHCVVDGAGTAAGTIDAMIIDPAACGTITISHSIEYMDDELCSVYNCFADLHVNTALALPQAQSPLLYTAEDRITSDGIVQYGPTEFLAGESVELKPGFEVILGTEFLADIDLCVSLQSLTPDRRATLLKALDEYRKSR